MFFSSYYTLEKTKKQRCFIFFGFILNFFSLSISQHACLSFETDNNERYEYGEKIECFYCIIHKYKHQTSFSHTLIVTQFNSLGELLDENIFKNSISLHNSTGYFEILYSLFVVA